MRRVWRQQLYLYVPHDSADIHGAFRVVSDGLSTTFVVSVCTHDGISKIKGNQLGALDLCVDFKLHDPDAILLHVLEETTRRGKQL